MHKHLGEEYTAMACYGHILDLANGSNAVDPDDDFSMRYTLIERNRAHLNAIIRVANESDTIYLATDPDREGEAISWDLYETLKTKGLLENRVLYRIVFHEFTGAAIRQAIANPRSLNKAMIEAQHARRALDYLVGYNLSPLLWRKIRSGLSAGRVQSPALRMIVDRETEIENFCAREYWLIDAEAEAPNDKDTPFCARLVILNRQGIERFSIPDKLAAENARHALQSAAKLGLRVCRIEKQQQQRLPAAPFTTASLQQEAAHKLGFSPQRTMRVAQALYEGLSGDGLITYMRTDSVSLSAAAVADIRRYINENYGSDQTPKQPRHYSNPSKNAQEAHEAIRPTSVMRTPEKMATLLGHDQRQLYQLIWVRTIACQMNHASIDILSIELAAGDAGKFHAQGKTIREPGFIVLYEETQDEADPDEASAQSLPKLRTGQSLNLKALDCKQRFTRAPPRYTEASLINRLESHGIGRPSTYASIISVLLNRDYVSLEHKHFYPSDIGRIVGNFLGEHFSRYVGTAFTAEMEEALDAIARGEQAWKPILQSFWMDFRKQLELKAEIPRSEVLKTRVLGIDPASGKPVSVRMGQFGPYAQIGRPEDSDKPRFASLEAGQKLSSLSLEEALKLFILPRQLGMTEDGEPISTSIGRFGPYVRYANHYVSLTSHDDPYRIDLDRALELIAAKQALDAKRYIKTFSGSDIQIIKGRYGPYISDGKTNARIPKKQKPETLSLAQCQTLIKQARNNKTKRHKQNKTKPIPPSS